MFSISSRDLSPKTVSAGVCGAYEVAAAENEVAGFV